MRWLFSCVFLVGCASSGGQSQTDTFGDFAVVTSTEGRSIVVRASPSPPVRGVDTFEFTVTQGGQPVDGLSLSVQPFMTAHGHGASVVPEVTAEGNGKYRIDDVSLFMPGQWELRTQMGEDHATITVDVP